MSFNRRFHESEDVDFDALAKKYGHYTSLEDMAYQHSTDVSTIKEVFDIITKYPMISDVDGNNLDGNEKVVLDGFRTAMQLGYVNTVYQIEEVGENDVEFAAIDMDVDKVAKCCGMTKDEFIDAINLGDEMPLDADTLAWAAGMQIVDEPDSEDAIQLISTCFGYDDDDDDEEDMDESTKRTVNVQISNLKESIFKAKRTLARLQNMKESDKSGSKKDMLRKITSAWGQEIFGYAPAVTFLDDDNFDIKFKSHEDAEQFADLWSEALDFSYDDYIENAENMSYSPIDEDTYDNLQKIYDKIVGETPSVEDFGVGSAEYELAENIDGNVIHSYFSNF